MSDPVAVVELSKSAAKKEAQRLEKAAKFQAKQAAKAQKGTADKKDKPDATAAGGSGKASKKAEEPEYVNTTPTGEKKGPLKAFCDRKLVY